MAEERTKFPEPYRRKADDLRRAFDAYLKRLKILRKERNGVIERFMGRIERAKIEKIRKTLGDD